MAGTQTQKTPRLQKEPQPGELNTAVEKKKKHGSVAVHEVFFQLLQGAIIACSTTKSEAPPGFNSNGTHYNLRSRRNISCDEVYPQVFLGDAVTAKNKDYLKRINVTHLLNAAEHVKTEADYYKDAKIKYLGYQLRDVESTDIGQFFEGAAEFIEEAVSTGGRVFVHCRKGVSRSATLVIAYLMIKKNMSAHEALCAVKKSRWIRPNDGFLRQLVMLDNKLRKKNL